MRLSQDQTKSHLAYELGGFFLRSVQKLSEDRFKYVDAHRVTNLLLELSSTDSDYEVRWEALQSKQLDGVSSPVVSTTPVTIALRADAGGRRLGRTGNWTAPAYHPQVQERYSFKLRPPGHAG